MAFSGLPAAQLEALRRMGGLDMFEITRRGAKELMAAEKRGGPIPEHLDFGVQEQCIACMCQIRPPKKALRCSQCKAVILCSKECMNYYWNQGARQLSSYLQPTHKQLCEDNKRHMKRLPETQAIVRMFPWGRLETDGTFNYDIACARFGVLGSAGYGYWSQRGGMAPHAENGPLGSGTDPTMGGLLKLEEFIDGNDLLKQAHLSDEQGWKLPPRLIPYLDFSQPSARVPSRVTELSEPIKDWKSWYDWRGLPLESPAALLMAAPLSVYHMLVHCLEVTSPSAGSEGKRVPLRVHVVGAEVELNYIPLFSELALLLPYHDIDLVFFGGAVKALVDAARRKPGALAAQSPVHSYTAPAALGSGRVTVQLHGASKTWPVPEDDDDLPDALVACNAGLGSYPEWVPVVRAAHLAEVPFAVTEYAEQSAEQQRRTMPQWLEGVPVAPRAEYPIALNPFQRPGQRGLAVVRVPNVSNGFTLTVVKK